MCRGRNTPENKNKTTGLTGSPHLTLLGSHLSIRSYCQTLGEIKAILTEGGSRGCAAADGAEESGLVEAQLLQLLRVLCQRGGKQQLLQRHLGWRQTANKTRELGPAQLFPWLYSLKWQGSAVPGCRDVCRLGAPEYGRSVRFTS